MEEDNESTASGSILNLANTSNNSAVIGETRVLLLFQQSHSTIHLFFSSLYEVDGVLPCQKRAYELEMSCCGTIKLGREGLVADQSDEKVMF